ncbi:hypothetical protein FNV43_RR17094 [Rhamnella rubrinervis]|uniref:Far1-related sequence 3 n=1 Tax=Rhamnella rubrinervis TaxID=2594499 RepID=A0A8K0GUI0_9ROSA|nr:hypothetical protein FNV43_RR17094 [Rhamnella rubrinervis]
MGLKLETRNRGRKFSIVLIRTCYRSVCNHPFLLGMVCTLIFLYRSFPFLFSLLVSASPVLVCTAVLLGTLLSFGQPNIPEIGKEEEENITHGIAAFRTGVSENDTIIVGRDESFFMGRDAGEKGDAVENSIEEASSMGNKVSKVEDDGGSIDNVPLVDEISQEIHTKKRLIEKVEREFKGFELEKNGRDNEEEMKVEGMLSDGQGVVDQHYLINEMGNNIPSIEVDNSPGVSVKDRLDSSLVGDGDDENDNSDDFNEDGSSDSGSDGAESSSPDASMADIIPMLDELHPLLETEAPRRHHLTHDESDAVSEQSHRSSDNSGESDEDIEIQGEVEEDGVDDNEDDEEAQGGKEDDSKSAIKWTEDDQKNLMDLGTSELERNQRLENLIARRRQRKSFKMMAEKNLIDLDSTDLPFNVAPIATTRRNPFDLPFDSNDNMGLPPIPGSAPSILLPRRNPFDLPYESNEEKPDLKGDSFEQEFTTFHQKDIFFRRHESFSVGPSSLGFPRHEKQDIKWRPVFIPERLASEGASYSSFQRQSSEVSDSKLSSVPDTESVSSGADPDEKILSEEDFSKEKELISDIYQASNLVEHGSSSSEDVVSGGAVQIEKREMENVEFEITLGEVDNHSESESSLSEAGEGANDVELNTSEIQLETEPAEEECSGRSSLSSLSEVDEKISGVENKDGSSSLEASGDHVNESVNSPQPSLRESEFQFMSGVVDENLPEEPVYDSSPPAVKKALSLSSISSDTQAEILEMVKPPPSEEMNVLFEDEESKVHGEIIEKDTYRSEEMSATSTSLHVVDGIPLGSGEVMETNENVSRAGSSGSGPVSDDQNGSMVSGSMAVRASVDSSSSLSDITSVEEGGINQEESPLYEQDHLRSSSLDVEIPVAVDHDEYNNLDSLASGDQISSEDLTISDLSTSKTGVLQEQVVRQEETVHLYEDQMHSSDSSEKRSLEEDMSKNRISHPEEDQVQSSSIYSEMQVVSAQVLSVQSNIPASAHQHTPHSNSSSPSLEGGQTSLVLEQVSVVNPSVYPSEIDHIEDHSVNEQENTLVEQEQLHPTNSDACIDASLPQGSDLKLALELEKDLSWSDKAMVEPCFDDHNVLNEPVITAAVPKGDSSINSDVREPAVKELTYLSSGTSDSALIPTDSPKYKSSLGELDLKGSMLDEIVNEEHSRVSEHYDFQREAHVLEENINDVDEIKEIDEGLLSELDTVGDFSVKTMDGESLHEELIPQEANAGSTNLGMLPSDSNLTQTNMELPVLEARSMNDIDMAFEKLHEGVDVEEVILPSVVEDQQVREESKDPMETTSDLQVVEARSLEDTHIALKQDSDVDVGEQPKLFDAKDGSAVGEKEVGPTQESESGSKGKESGTEEPKHDLHETSENPESSISSTGAKKDNADKATSGSSSSSS